MASDLETPEPIDFASHIDERFDIWRIILGIFLVSALWLGAAIGMGFLAAAFFPDLAEQVFENTVGLGNHPEDLAFVLLTFLPVWIGLAVVLPLLHHRAPLALLGPSHRVN